MAIRIKIKMVVHSRNNRDLPPTQGSLTQVTWDKVERTRNAFRTLGLWLVFTFIAIFIPILHWVLVPGLLITSFVLALDKMNEVSRNEGGTGECPKCHQTFTVQTSNWTGRTTENCDHCHEDLELTIQ